MSRRHNFQTVSWFNDLYSRGILDLDPPYQRRSVWNQRFKDDFIDTVLLNYPAPAIFLYEDITADGRSLYHVVDGKQRLTTLLEFLRDQFPLSESSEVGQWSGQYFSSLPDELKRAVWGYQFLVEYVPNANEKLINGIFDRINRNVAKLTPQELRHARLNGAFISAADSLTEWMDSTLPSNFPRFAHQSKRQMKDVEFVALLLLLIESGPQGYSQSDLDAEFTDRDQTWDTKVQVENRFRAAVSYIREVLAVEFSDIDLTSTRLRNQADFYALVGAVDSLAVANQLPQPEVAAQRLRQFAKEVEDPDAREAQPDLSAYYEAARSASNDKGPRETRVAYFKAILGT